MITLQNKGNSDTTISFIVAQSCACVLSMHMLRTSLHSFVLMLVFMLTSSGNSSFRACFRRRISHQIFMQIDLISFHATCLLVCSYMHPIRKNATAENLSYHLIYTYYVGEGLEL